MSSLVKVCILLLALVYLGESATVYNYQPIVYLPGSNYYGRPVIPMAGTRKPLLVTPPPPVIVTTAAPTPAATSSSIYKNEEFTEASNDLEAIYKDLNTTVEWLKTTNETVHGVMLKALQAYVTLIERRVDNQVQFYRQTSVRSLKMKIAVIKEKVAGLIERLKSLVPFKVNNAGSINRADSQPTETAATSPSPLVSTSPSISTTIPAVAAPVSATTTTTTTSTTSQLPIAMKLLRRCGCPVPLMPSLTHQQSQ